MCLRMCGRAVLLGLMLGASMAQARDQVYEARVTRVSDGDTLWVSPLDGGRYRKLRLDGVDAPEICQAGGDEARQALTDRLLHQVVWVHERRRDDYGRGLVRIRDGGGDVASWLVQEGLAWSYRWGRGGGPFEEEESRARAHRKGLFANADAEEPRIFRRRHGPCPMPARLQAE